jgi:2-keto-4-pentenoate hydratase/2-oxohepta-3-ene-1,7-dioic acid hydratase in catechol pathway
MKLASYRAGGVDSFGVVEGDALTDAGKALAPEGVSSLRDALARDPSLRIVRDAIGGRDPEHALSDVEFLPVIPDPGRIICVGLNYESHRLETGKPKAPHPVLFVRFPDSLVGHGRSLVRPLESDKYDYEGELAVVIGREGRRIAREGALEHVAGYACFQDGSVRDWQGHSTQFTAGKNFAATGACGPWLVTADELPPWNQLSLSTRINGQSMQEGRLDDLTFGIPELIAYISTFAPLRPGDVIATGTPSGVGYVRRPPVYLQPGDTVEVEIGGIGTLSNPVIAEA